LELRDAVHLDLVFTFGVVEQLASSNKLVTQLISLLLKRRGGSQSRIVLFSKGLDLVFSLDVLAIELTLDSCLVDIVLFQFSDFSLSIAGLISELLQLSCGHFTLSILLFDGHLQTTLLVGQFIHL
jgi:hypothetical protein